MSEENVEIVQLLAAAWNRRDVESILALMDPEVEYVNAPEAVEPGTRRGREGVASVFRTQWESLPDAVQVVDRFHDRGDEIISEGRVSRAMPGSDTRIEVRALIAWTLREGRIVRVEVLGAGTGFDAARDRSGLPE